MPHPSPTGNPFVRWVTVLFAPTIASLREVAKRREGSVEPERDRAAARRWTAIAGEGESGINGYRSLYSERCPLFCGRGGETSVDCLYRTLTQSPTVPALSRRKPWFERTLCTVRTSIVRGGDCYSREHMECSPTKNRSLGA